MSPVFHSEADIIDWVGRHTGAIGLEGFCGSGKSYLAKRVVHELGYAEVDTDAFVVLKDGDWHYPERLDIHGLRNLFDDLRSKFDSKILAHGICLRETLARMSREVDTFIYIKRVTQPVVDEVLWHDGIDLEMLKDGEVRLNSHDEPHRSAFKYHIEHAPHERADAYYVRKSI